MKYQYDKKAKQHTFKVGDKVLLREYMKQVGKNKKFSDKYRGPYTLIETLSPVTFRLGGLENKRMNDTSHVNRMKHFPNIETREIRPPNDSLIPENNPGNSLLNTENNLEDPEIPVNSNDDVVIRKEKNSQTPKIFDKPSDIPKWKDLIVVLNHRFRNQRVEYLVKQEGESDSLAFWQKDVTLKDNPRIIEYMKTLQKPNTRSKTQNKTAIVYTTDVRNSNFDSTKKDILRPPREYFFDNATEITEGITSSLKVKTSRKNLKSNLSLYNVNKPITYENLAKTVKSYDMPINCKAYKSLSWLKFKPEEFMNMFTLLY